VPKHTFSLHDVGDKVKITDGEHKGLAGTVIGLGHIGSRDLDTTHVVKLAEPKKVSAEKTEVINGRTYTSSEDATIDSVEVPSSMLEDC
jgi:hypothetical protein